MVKEKIVLKFIRRQNVNFVKMAGDLKGIEKILKPALEKFMQDSGFVKETELENLKKSKELKMFKD